MSAILPAFLLTAVALMIQADMSPRIGDPAPDFSLPSATADSINSEGTALSDYRGKNIVVLAFYPADWSGGCTREMCGFRDDFGDLQDLNTIVLGISGDYVFSHFEWAKHHNIPFPLLSDHHHTVSRKYGSFNEETGYNRRTIIVVDLHGRVAYTDTAFRAGSEEHLDRLRQSIRKLQSTDNQSR